jgi:hypothetical protein
LDNGRRTNERLIIKTIYRPPGNPLDSGWHWIGTFVLVSRYPVAANQEWIEANQQEIVEWKFGDQNRKICFSLE